MVGFLEAKITEVWGPPKTGPPVEFLTLKLVYTNPPAVNQLQVRFSYSGPRYLMVICDFLYLPISTVLGAVLLSVISVLE